jgi:hypothetical protein
MLKLMDGGKDLDAEAKRLIEERFLAGGIKKLRLSGTSMNPSMFCGEEITVRRACCRDFAVGDIAVFKRGGMLIAHRAIGNGQDKGGPYLMTKGDRSSAKDAPVPEAEIVGRVEKLLSKEGCHDFRTGYWRCANRIIGWLSAHEGHTISAAYRIKWVFLGRKYPGDLAYDLFHWAAGAPTKVAARMSRIIQGAG